MSLERQNIMNESFSKHGCPNPSLEIIISVSSTSLFGKHFYMNSKVKVHLNKALSLLLSSRY